MCGKHIERFVRPRYIWTDNEYGILVGQDAEYNTKSMAHVAHVKLFGKKRGVVMTCMVFTPNWKLEGRIQWAYSSITV